VKGFLDFVAQIDAEQHQEALEELRVLGKL